MGGGSEAQAERFGGCRMHGCGNTARRVGLGQQVALKRPTHPRAHTHTQIVSGFSSPSLRTRKHAAAAAAADAGDGGGGGGGQEDVRQRLHRVAPCSRPISPCDHGGSKQRQRWAQWACMELAPEARCRIRLPMGGSPTAALLPLPCSPQAASLHTSTSQPSTTPAAARADAALTLPTAATHRPTGPHISSHPQPLAAAAARRPAPWWTWMRQSARCQPLQAGVG